MEAAENKRFVYEFGKFVLDPNEKTLFSDGVPLHLPAKEFDTLVLFVEHNRKALSKDEMISAVWQDAFVEESNLAKQISRLRKILNTNGEEYIETLPKHGYRFSADLRRTYPVVEEPVFLEKRAVKRVTFAVENEIEDHPLALPPKSKRAITGFQGFVAFGLFALLGTGIWSLNRPTSLQPAKIDSLAVLPLKSLDAGDNYLGLGIADAVIRRISQTGELTVRPTSAVRRYLTEETDALAAARELNVDAVFEGTVQRADDRLRVSVNLLRTGDGKSLWSDSFDMRSADIFTIQDTVAQQVAARLRLHLNPTQQMRLAKQHTSNPVAYEYYLKGIYSLDQRSFSSEGKSQMEATIELFKQAISADPQYALAHAQLAFAYVWMAVFIELDPVWIEYARQEIRRAEALDSQLAETHVARHLILWSAFEGYQNEAAIRELLLAQQLNPSIGNLELGVLYWHNGLEDQADRALQRALEIDPTSEKVKAEIYNSTMLSGRTDEALAVQQRFFNSAPDLQYYLDKNRLNDAQPLLEQELAKAPNNHEVRLRKALFLALKKDFNAAEAEIPWILEHIPKNRAYHHYAYNIVRIYALAGKSQEAVKWLRETAATGKPCYPLFERDPYLNRIRQAPEFIQFMTEMKAQNERYRSEFEQAPKET